MIAAAIAVIAVANFCVVNIVASASDGTGGIFASVWPLVTVTTVAIILVMSFLYQAISHLLLEIETRERHARTLSHFDPLTGLANRRLLGDCLGSQSGDRRQHGSRFAVILIDLDHFKQVNDVLGHQSGDELLTIVADRLRSVAREHDTVARLGGDEFVIVQCHIENEKDVISLCERIRSALAEPVSIHGKPLSVCASIGYVLSEDTSLDGAEYMRRADIALYKAKSLGRDRSFQFSDELDDEVRRRAEIEQFLRRAIATKEGIEIYFQPQISTCGDELGVEALLRCAHPELGEIPPEEAIAVAEEIGVIDRLGELVFQQACYVAWAHPQIFVAVNVSPMQFVCNPQLADTLEQIAADCGVSCSQIEIEITETVLLDPRLGGPEIIANLRDKGFTVALDDFGTGYSSLSYLRRFAVDKIKLDKSFIDECDATESVAIMRAAVILARTLGLKVVAEGIETREHEQIALEAGCEGLQGFRYGKALPIGALDIHLGEAKSASFNSENIVDFKQAKSHRA